jgi:hypothetical protein
MKSRFGRPPWGRISRGFLKTRLRRTPWGRISRDLLLLIEVTLVPPAMGTHFAGLSLSKWSPGRAALK